MAKGQQMEDNVDWIFLMQDIRGYIRVFGAEQLLHDFHDLFPDEYSLLLNAVRLKEIKDFNTKKGVLLDAHQGMQKMRGGKAD